MMGFFSGVTQQSVADTPDRFKDFKVGDNEAFIKDVVEKFTKNGDPMLQITFSDESGAEIRYYIVDNEHKMRKLKQLYQAFDIPMGNTIPQSWIGKTGIVVVKEGTPYNGMIYNEISYFKPNPASTGAETHSAKNTGKGKEAPISPPTNSPSRLDKVPF